MKLSPQKTPLFGYIRDILFPFRKKHSRSFKRDINQTEFIRKLANNIPGLMGYWSSDLVCLFANKGYLDWFDKPYEDLLGPELLGNRVTIIALTANATTQDRQKAIDAGMDDVLTKPLRSARLADMLKKWRPDSDHTKLSGTG